MKFEIPLTETQQYVLRNVTVFSGLPLHFSQDDLKNNHDYYTELPESILPSWKLQLQKRKQKLDTLSERNKLEINAFYAEHTDLYEQCSVGRNRGDAAIAFRDALSPDARREHERLSEENARIFEEHQKISHGEASIYRRHSSKLLGIIGIASYLDDAPDYPELEFYNWRIIPRENFEAVHVAVISGIFSKEITPQDKDILRYIDNKSSARPQNKRSPSFSVVDVAVGLNLTEIPSVQERLYRLTGLLCHLYVPKDFKKREIYPEKRIINTPPRISPEPILRYPNIKKPTISEYYDRWFIPRARKTAIKEVLKA